MTRAQDEVGATLHRLGGEATILQIARAAGRKATGVGRVLRRLPNAREVPGSGTGSGKRWRLSGGQALGT
jgi:hypothetical protein